MEKFGLFRFIRETSFLKFFISWVISIFFFALIYWASSAAGSMSIGSEAVSLSISGLLTAIYASFLTATLFGATLIATAGILKILLYVQIGLTIAILFVLVDKLIQRWITPYYHHSHQQDKKINTVMLMLSIFRNDVDRIKHSYAAKHKQSIDIKEIEAVIDGLYAAFLDIEILFSLKNAHRHKIKSLQYVMVISNIEDSLEKLLGFMEFLEHHTISWKDKSTVFWIGYILETADKIIVSIDTSDIKNPKTIIALENIKEITQKIESKL